MPLIEHFGRQGKNINKLLKLSEMILADSTYYYKLGGTSDHNYQDYADTILLSHRVLFSEEDLRKFVARAIDVLVKRRFIGIDTSGLVARQHIGGYLQRNFGFNYLGRFADIIPNYGSLSYEMRQNVLIKTVTTYPASARIGTDEMMNMIRRSIELQRERGNML